MVARNFQGIPLLVTTDSYCPGHSRQGRTAWRTPLHTPYYSTLHYWSHLSLHGTLVCAHATTTRQFFKDRAHTHAPNDGIVQGDDVRFRIEQKGTLSRHLRAQYAFFIRGRFLVIVTNLYFGASHVLLLEQELPVQVAHIDGVQVHLEIGVVTATLARGGLILTTTRRENPVSTKFLMSSQPIPPAPTTSMRAVATRARSSSSRNAIYVTWLAWFTE